MMFETRSFPVFIRLAALGAIIITPLTITFSDVSAQGTSMERKYDIPSGHAFDPNKDGSRVIIGSRTEFEKRADIYEEENFRKRLEEQARQKHFRRFSTHDFSRPTGPFDDY